MSESAASCGHPNHGADDHDCGPFLTFCGEVYDYAIRTVVPTCQRKPRHDGRHRWSGEDGLNRVTLEWEWISDE